jgi:hypothetical protein
MKKDAIIALLAALVVAGVCFGLAKVRPPFQPIASKPFTYEAGASPQAAGRVVMRINGEPVTQTEFETVYAQLPEEMQRQFASTPGKMAFAEQLIRLKLMEQEARKLGLDRDPKVTAQVAADRANILANAAAQKIIASPTDDAVRTFYNQNRARFEAIDISHIVVAYEGGQIHPRNGRRPPTEAEAIDKALAVSRQLKKGADFPTMARRESDEVETAQRGGELGRFTAGMLPPELEARIWAMKPGQISEPIPSPLGIHIFRLNARATQPIEQMRTGITQRMRQQTMFERVEILRRNAKIDFDPKYFPLARTTPAPMAKRPS